MCQRLLTQAKLLNKILNICSFKCLLLCIVAFTVPLAIKFYAGNYDCWRSFLETLNVPVRLPDCPTARL